MQTDHQLPLPDYVDPAWRVGIVASSFYAEQMNTLVDGAVDTLRSAGLTTDRVQRYDVAGSFEVPLVGAALAEAGQVDALIGLGIIVEGQTHHARLLAEQAARGIMDVQLQYRLPFAFEILYVPDTDVLAERMDKGVEAARSVLHSLALLHRL